MEKKKTLGPELRDLNVKEMTMVINKKNNFGS